MRNGKMRLGATAIFKRLPVVRKVYDLKLDRDRLLTERPGIERQRDHAIRAREQGEARIAHLERELIRWQQAAEARQAELGRIADVERERGAAGKLVVEAERDHAIRVREQG